jgi:HEAT repeat protein
MGNEFNPADTDDRLAALLAERPAALASVDVARQREMLDELSDICRNVGPRAAAAVPLLITWPISADRNTEDSVCYALAHCAPASIAPLVELLDNRSDPLRARACRSLGLIGSEIGNRLFSISDGLLRRLKDPSQSVRKEAAFALGLVKDGRQLVIEQLTGLVREGASTDRAAALHALGNLGSEAREGDAGRDASPIASWADLVIDGLIDPDECVRRSACHALEVLGLPSLQHLDHLIRILAADVSAIVQERAASQLPRLADRADISGKVAELIPFIQRERRIACNVCEALGKAGPGARAAMPALLEALADEEGFVALAAAEAIWHIEKRADLVLPTLRRLFDDWGERVCDIAYLMGPDAGPLLPQLLDVLADDDYWDLQWAAADAIGSVASASPQTMAALQKALAHESGIVRSAACNAFSRIGEPAVVTLLEWFEVETDPKLREWIAAALSRMGPKARLAIPALHSQLQSQVRGLRIWVAIALAEIASAPEAVPTLISALENDEMIRIWDVVCNALASIGPAASPARNLLIDLCGVPVDEIQNAAKQAIVAIDRKLS